MKIYIYLFITIILLLIITLNTFYECREGYNTSYSGPSGLYSLTDPSKKTSIMTPSPTQSKTKYNSNNLNVEYHDSAEDIQKQMGIDPSANLIMVLDKSGKLVQVPISHTANDTTFYEEANLRYEPSNFVPTYEDTIYFSKLTGLGYQQPIYGTDSQLGGFCSFNKDFPDKIEEKCGKLDGDICASTSCCVFIGGKCVAGNKNGPKKKSHYQKGDIDRKDNYFFMGKCYGNCVDDQSNYYNYNNEILTKNNNNIHKLNLKTSPYDENYDYNDITSV